MTEKSPSSKETKLQNDLNSKENNSSGQSDNQPEKDDKDMSNSETKTETTISQLQSEQSSKEIELSGPSDDQRREDDQEKSKPETKTKTTISQLTPESLVGSNAELQSDQSSKGNELSAPSDDQRREDGQEKSKSETKTETTISQLTPESLVGGNAELKSNQNCTENNSSGHSDNQPEKDDKDMSNSETKTETTISQLQSDQSSKGNELSAPSDDQRREDDQEKSKSETKTETTISQLTPESLVGGNAELKSNQNCKENNSSGHSDNQPEKDEKDMSNSKTKTETTISQRQKDQNSEDYDSSGKSDGQHRQDGQEKPNFNEAQDKQSIQWIVMILIPLLAVILYAFAGSSSKPEVRRTIKSTIKEKELRMIIFGESGSGKSATGNTILDKNVFNAVLSGQSTINTVKMGTKKRFGYKLVVLDTPDISKVENISLEISKCYGMTSPGLHAILLVVGIGRLHDELVMKLMIFLSYFGEDAKSFITVIFTFKLKLEQDGLDITEYILSLPSTLTDVLKSINGRYVVMGYKGDKKERDKEVERLIEMISENKKDQPHGVLYNENYQKFEEFIQSMENKTNNRDVIRKKIENGNIKEFPKIRKNNVKSFGNSGFRLWIVETLWKLFQ